MNYKRALITGASSGIGAATAEALAAAGMDSVLLARRAERLSDLQKALQGRHKIKVVTLVADVRRRADVEGVFAKAASELESVDVLVNNAGLAKGVAKFDQIDLDDCDQMLETNVSGLLYVTRALLPQMVRRKHGHIVNLGSVAGRLVYPGGAVYCATKFAVRALSDGLRMDLAGTGIRVTNIEPGMVESEFSEVRFGDSEKARAVYKGMLALQPADIAETIRWSLAQPAHVNIQELVVYPTAQASVGMVHRVDSAKPV